MNFPKLKFQHLHYFTQYQSLLICLSRFLYHLHQNLLLPLKHPFLLSTISFIFLKLLFPAFVLFLILTFSYHNLMTFWAKDVRALSVHSLFCQDPIPALEEGNQQMLLPPSFWICISPLRLYAGANNSILLFFLIILICQIF